MIIVTESYEAEKELLYPKNRADHEAGSYSGYYKDTHMNYPTLGLHGRGYRAGYYVLYFPTKEKIGFTREGALAIPVEDPNIVFIKGYDCGTVHKSNSVEQALRWVDNKYTIDTDSEKYNEYMAVINAYIKLRDAGELKTPEECLVGVKTQDPLFKDISSRIKSYRDYVRKSVDKKLKEYFKNNEEYSGMIFRFNTLSKKKGDTKFTNELTIRIKRPDSTIPYDIIDHLYNFICNSVILSNDNTRIDSISDYEIEEYNPRSYGQDITYSVLVTLTFSGEVLMN